MKEKSGLPPNKVGGGGGVPSPQKIFFNKRDIFRPNDGTTQWD